jgi:hypothetical protein
LNIEHSTLNIEEGEEEREGRIRGYVLEVIGG